MPEPPIASSSRVLQRRRVPRRVPGADLFSPPFTLFRRQERPAKQISEARYFPRALPRVGPPRGKALARRRKSSIQRVRSGADPFLILSLWSLRFNGHSPLRRGYIPLISAPLPSFPVYPEPEPNLGASLIWLPRAV